MRCTEKAAPGTSCTSTTVYCWSLGQLTGSRGSLQRIGPFVREAWSYGARAGRRSGARYRIWLGLGWGLQVVRSWCLGLDAQKQFARRTSWLREYVAIRASESLAA